MRARVVTSRLTAVMLAAMVALLLVALVVDRDGWGRDRPTDATALLTTGRNGLRVCVESHGTDPPPSAIRAHVQAGLARVSRHPDFTSAGLGRRPVEVHEGCRAVPSIDLPNYRSSSRFGAPVAVTPASPYRLMVFVMPPGRMATAFEGRDPAVTAQEVMCDAGRCPVVTTAAYLSPAILADPELLDRALIEGIGLRQLDESTPHAGGGN